MHDSLKLDNQLCFRLYTASRLLIQAYRPLLAPLGITYPQYLVLLALWEKDNQLVGELCRRLTLDTNTLTPLLQRMEADGLIIRTRGIADGRQTLVSLTKKGQHMEEAAIDFPDRIARSWQNRYSNKTTARRLMADLDTLLDGLQQQAKAKKTAE